MLPLRDQGVAQGAWICAGRQAASAGGAGVVSARLPERLVRRYRSRADWTGLDGIGRDWSPTHSPVAALGGGVTYYPHRSEPKALHTSGAPSSTRFGSFGSNVNAGGGRNSLTADHDVHERITSHRPGPAEAAAKMHARLPALRSVPQESRERDVGPTRRYRWIVAVADTCDELVSLPKATLTNYLGTLSNPIPSMHVRRHPPVGGRSQPRSGSMPARRRSAASRSARRRSSLSRCSACSARWPSWSARWPSWSARWPSWSARWPS